MLFCLVTTGDFSLCTVRSFATVFDVGGAQNWAQRRWARRLNVRGRPRCFCVDGNVAVPGVHVVSHGELNMFSRLFSARYPVIQAVLSEGSLLSGHLRLPIRCFPRCSHRKPQAGQPAMHEATRKSTVDRLLLSGFQCRLRFFACILTV